MTSFPGDFILYQPFLKTSDGTVLNGVGKIVTLCILVL